MRTHQLTPRPRSAAAIAIAALAASLLSAGSIGASGSPRAAGPVVAGKSAAQVGEAVALGSLTDPPPDAATAAPAATAPTPPGDLTVAVTSLRSLLLPPTTAFPTPAGSSTVPSVDGSAAATPAAGDDPSATTSPAQASTSPTTTTPAEATTSPAGGVWAELRQCESGGNYAIDTGNGYYGAYQFSEATWLGIGETGYPYQAPPAVQDAAAEALQARSGWGQWPACSAKLGL
jgi:hypothetical protein